jgi:putative ABC transport system ATP-binding protein
MSVNHGELSPASSTPLLRAHGVSRIYQNGTEKVWAVRKATLSLSRGELVLIQGKSGSGKTTLLNLLGGLEKPSFGSVFYREKKLSSFSHRELISWRRHTISFIFQAFALVSELTAHENVDLPLRIAGSNPKRATSLALEYLDMVDMKKRAHHRVYELSGGEQQRVAIARGLIGDSQIVLADEPTGELDFATGQQVLKLFRSIVKNKGLAMCITSHDPAAAPFADKIFTIVDGTLNPTGDSASMPGDESTNGETTRSDQ